MNPRFFCLPSSHFHRLLLAALCALPLAGGACSDDGGDETPVADYAVEVTRINDTAAGESIALRCDATLAVEVAISTSDPSVPFVLKPAYACGTSTRCGYVHIEALDADDQVLASVDTATLAGVLTLPSADVVPTSIRAILLSGVDREPIENPNGDEPSTTVEPSFELPPTTCEVPGAGGEGGGAPSGGAPGGGAPGGGAPGGGAPGGGAPSGGAPSGGAPSGGGEGGTLPSAGTSGAASGSDPGGAAGAP